jgi:hypothetical protein
MEEAEQPSVKPEHSEARQTQKLQSRQRQIFDQEDDEDHIDTSTVDKKKRMIPQQQRNYYDNSESMVDPDRAATARSIFEDPNVLRDRVTLAQK